MSNESGQYELKNMYKYKPIFQKLKKIATKIQEGQKKYLCWTILQLWIPVRYKYPCWRNFHSLALSTMGMMVSGLLVALLLHGLTANQGLEDLNNPTARENDFRMNMEKLDGIEKRVLPLQSPWLVKLLRDNYSALLMKQTLTI